MRVNMNLWENGKNMNLWEKGCTMHKYKCNKQT